MNVNPRVIQRPNADLRAPMRAAPAAWIRRNWLLIALGLILVGAAVLRLYRLGAVPPGLATDDAMEGLDATRVLQGEWQIWFPALGGREPLFVYLVAASVKVFGPTAFALELPAALAGIATVLTVYLVVREMVDARVGLLTAALVALSYWALHESRIGERVILVPLVVSSCFYFFWRGWKRGGRANFIASGVLLGLTVYTYGAARIVPAILFLFLLAMFFVERATLRSHWRDILLLVLFALLVFAPLGVYFWLHPESFFQRYSEVASNDLTLTHFVTLLEQNLLPTLKMFSVQGDIQWKHNLAGRPVFDLVGAVLFYMGIGIALWRVRRPQYLFLSLWLVLGLLPGAISDESPHFMRTIVALPPTYIFPALTLVTAVDFLRARWHSYGARIAWAGVLVFLVYSGALTIRDYFSVFATHPDAYHFFYGDLVAVNDLLNTQPSAERAYVSVEFADYNATIMNYLGWQRPKPVVRLFDAGRGLVFSRAQAAPLYIFPWTSPQNPLDERWLGSAPLVSQQVNEKGLTLFRAYQPKDLEFTPQEPLAATLGDAVRVVGYTVIGTPKAGETLTILLDARKSRAVKLDKTYKFFAHLTDSAGYEWSSDEGIASQVSEWLDDEDVVTWFHLPIPPDAPPKNYLVEFGLYSPIYGRVNSADASGKVTGTTVSTSPIRITGGNGGIGASPIPYPLDQVTLNELELRGYDLSADTFHGGDTARVTLYWQANGKISKAYQMALALVSANQEVVARRRFDPVQGEFPTTQWQPGSRVRDSVIFNVPNEIQTGEYTLSVSLEAAGAPEKFVPITRVKIEASEHNFTMPVIKTPQNATLGTAIEYLGYGISPAPIKPGDSIFVTLYWRAKDSMSTSYTVFTHLIGSDNRVWGQRDRIPGNGARPTTSWVKGEILTDRYRIPVESDTPPGEYAIEIGMYDSNTIERLPILDAAGARVPYDRLVIAHIPIVAP